MSGWRDELYVHTALWIFFGAMGCCALILLTGCTPAAQTVVPVPTQTVATQPSIDAAEICTQVAANPTANGITTILAQVVKDTGVEPSVAFRGVTVAVAFQCPDLLPALQKFMDAYQPTPEYRQGYVA